MPIKKYRSVCLKRLGEFDFDGFTVFAGHVDNAQE